MLRREPGIAAASGRYQLLCQHCGIQGTAGTRQCQVEGTSCCVKTAVYRGLQALDSVKWKVPVAVSTLRYTGDCRH